ncbi:hypothetical protein [Fulvivirga sp.]|uniref:TolB family protein n=1 Tax=Fulvivirga sp. TaxID=1931237 RepID=UPI0032ED07EC
MNKYITIIAAFFLGTQAFSQEAYLNQKPPGLEPGVFAPNIVSLPDQHEYGSVFSADGLEFFFAIAENGKNEILTMKFANGNWGKPETILEHKTYSYNDPMLSPNGERLYFISDRPLDGKGDVKDYDIWYVEREGEFWTKPINVGYAINSEKNEYYISFSAEGTLYFSSNKNADEGENYNYDIYSSQYRNGKFSSPIKLDTAINTGRYEADVFISPDEDYMIFCAIRKEGMGQGDLYISFKDDVGNWKPAQNMGPKINNELHQLCPFVTTDGKYFFFTSNQDIYWVDAQIIDSYR